MSTEMDSQRRRAGPVNLGSDSTAILDSLGVASPTAASRSHDLQFLRTSAARDRGGRCRTQRGPKSRVARETEARKKARRSFGRFDSVVAWGSIEGYPRDEESRSPEEALRAVVASVTARKVDTRIIFEPPTSRPSERHRPPFFGPHAERRTLALHNDLTRVAQKQSAGLIVSQRAARHSD